MNKAILVIDMPKGCCECPLAVETGAYDSCCITGTRITSNDNFKFPWCPLKPMPDKQRFNGVVDYDNDYLYGWNACINKILSD